MTHLTIHPTHARQLIVTKQRLDANMPASTPEGILDAARSIRCFQLDPISAVAKSNTLVLFSRVGAYSQAAWDAVMWEQRMLFEYWAHAASIVLTEDYPLHRAMMQSYVKGDSAWEVQVREWVAQNLPLRDYILSELRQNGAMPSRLFEQEGLHPTGWVSTGWTSGRNVSRMLDYLWICGEIMVTGRSGGQKIWDLTERCLPSWADQTPLSPHDVTLRAVPLAVQALGVARSADIRRHFIRNRYANIDAVIKQLLADGMLTPVQIASDSLSWGGKWYMHADDLPLLESIRGGKFAPRTTLISPFDNLICDRDRTRLIWDFDFTIEIYVPKAKRKFGYYVMPILHGDRLIGRVDAQVNRKTRTYELHALYFEDGFTAGSETIQYVITALRSLAEFVGAATIALTDPDRIPADWRPHLRAL
jgi:uncharacterized protein